MITLTDEAAATIRAALLGGYEALAELDPDGRAARAMAALVNAAILIDQAKEGSTT